MFMHNVDKLYLYTLCVHTIYIPCSLELHSMISYANLWKVISALPKSKSIKIVFSLSLSPSDNLVALQTVCSTVWQRWPTWLTGSLAHRWRHSALVCDVLEFVYAFYDRACNFGAGSSLPHLSGCSCRCDATWRSQR